MSTETAVESVNEEQETPKTETQAKPESSSSTATETELLKLINQQNEKILRLEVQAASANEVTEDEILKDLDAHAGKAPDMSKIDIETLSNAELAGLIMSEVERAFFVPVVHRVELLRVREELKEVKSKYEGFEEFKDQTHKIASANPSMSIEDAFIHAKAKAGSQIVLKGAKKEAPSKVVDISEADKGKPQAKEAKVRPEATGLKPGNSSATVEKSNPKNLTEAVDLAFAKVFKE